MKTIYIALCAGVSVVSTMKAQTQTTVEPFYTVNGERQSFEKATAKIEAKAIGMGYGGINNYLTVFGSSASPVRFKKGEIPRFFVTMPSYASADHISIVRADKVKGKNYRRFIQRGMNGMGGGDKDMSKYHISLPLKKQTDGSYEILIPQDLETGEYSFIINSSAKAYDPFAAPGSESLYCFGIE